jgi:transposase
MSKAQVARTFSVSLSSVKRYANKAERGESLAAKKALALLRSWSRPRSRIGPVPWACYGGAIILA